MDFSPLVDVKVKGFICSKDHYGANKNAHTPHTDKGYSLTSSVWLPGVKFSPERNAVEVGALDLPEIL